MGHQDGVVPAGVQGAIGLIGQAQRAKQAAAFQLQFDIEVDLFRFDDVSQITHGKNPVEK
jgi:hypothetical protein